MTADRPFQRVQAWVRKIPRGRVLTYGQLSELIDGRLTPVGVGWAIRAADDLPWHRVVNSKGRLSTERANPGLQRRMLEAENVKFDGQGQIDLHRYGWKPRRPPRRRGL
jgi:methylated-DNA-protein-cysteine methyltransferase-like protein